MKIFKLTDVLIQATLILLSIMLLLTCTLKDPAFVAFYFVLGGWQLISHSVNSCLSKSTWFQSKERSAYEKTLYLMFQLLIASILINFIFHGIILFYLAGLLFISPVLAFWYLHFSIKELKRIYFREIIHLKN